MDVTRQGLHRDSFSYRIDLFQKKIQCYFYDKVYLDFAADAKLFYFLSDVGERATLEAVQRKAARMILPLRYKSCKENPGRVFPRRRRRQWRAVWKVPYSPKRLFYLFGWFTTGQTSRHLIWSSEFTHEKLWRSNHGLLGTLMAPTT